MVILGIDFGTSSTAAVVRLDDGRAVPLLFGETPLLPSAVCVTVGGEFLVGRDAVQASRSRPDAFEAHAKSRIDDGEVLLGGRAVPVAELIGAVLRRVHDEAVRVAGAPIDRLVLAHPAGWGARRRQTLLGAAAIADLPPAVLVSEPVAAAVYYAHVLGHVVPLGSCLVVYDFGAGTFDASVVRHTASGFVVLAEEGILDAGGLDLDAAIVAHLGAVYGAGDPESWRRLTAPVAPADQRTSRTFWDDVRVAKEALSRTSMTTIFVPILEREAVFGREHLEHLARPLLDRTVAATQLAVRSAGLRAEELAAVFLVGGSSRMSLPATLLHRALGIVPTVIEQPELIVAGGTLYVGDAEPLIAEPPVTNEELESAPPEASTMAVAVSPEAAAATLHRSDPQATIAAPISRGHDLVGRNELEAQEPVGEADLAADLPVPAPESVEPPPVATDQSRTAAAPMTPAVPAHRSRRRLLAVVASALAIVVVAAVVISALQSEPPAADAAHVSSSSGAVTRTNASAAPPSAVAPPLKPTRIATLNDHKHSVTSVAFSPDGKTMATASFDENVIVWNVANPAAPTHIATLNDEGKTVHSVAFSPDGKTIATASEDTSVVMWNVANPAAPARIATLNDHKSPVYSVAFSPDGKTMATGGAKAVVMVWNVAEPTAPTRIATLTDHQQWVNSVAFSPDGKTMATAGADNKAMVWNVTNPAAPTRIATLNDHHSTVFTVAFSPDRKTMATAGGDKAMVWNVTNPATPTVLATLNDGEPVSTLAFSSKGGTMATADANGVVVLWSMANPAAPARLATLNDHNKAVEEVAFSPDGNTMATASDDTTVMTWRLTST